MTEQPEKPEKPDWGRAKALYPAPVDTSTLQGKVHLWVYGEVQKLWGEMPSHIYVGDFPIFLTGRERAAFCRWWKGYVAAFEGGEPPSKAFFPAPPSGITGSRACAVMHAPHQHDKHYCSLTGTDARLEHEIAYDPIRALRPLLTQWVWFAANCRASVWRLYGGWLFANAGDLAAYQLYNFNEKED